MNPKTSPAQVLRFCPRCGASGLSAGTRSRFDCPACAFVLYLDVAAAVAAIVRDEGGRVLLTRRAREPQRGKLDIPGGFVDQGETAEEALRRELHEELNLEVVDLEYFCTEGNEYDYAGLLYHTLDVYYLCKVRGLSSIRPADDICDFVFLPVQELCDADVGFESVRRALARLRRQS